MKERIAPVGLKGNEINERIKSLMGVTQINENNKTSVLELTKVGPDGRVYGIVRENHEYFIKTTNKKNNLIVEDFAYIGGLQNKKQEAYPSYAKAIKHLNLKFNSLNNAYDKSGQINVFENDNLSSMHTGFSNEGNLDTNTMSECCGAQMMEGMCMECGGMGMYEVELSDKQKDIAKLAGDKEKFGADDLAALRDGAKMENESMGMMREKEFPDLTGDGKFTYADILKGRGVQLDNEGLSPEMEAVDTMMEYDDDYDDYDDDDEIEFADPGGNSALRAGNRQYPCPTCDSPNALTADDVNLGYQCDDCADRAEGKYQYEGKKMTGKLSIERAINKMDSIIESIVNRKKKVYTLK
jgi:hypothetical protein